MLRPVTRYAICPRPAAQPEDSDLLRDGAATGTVLPGVVLEAQFAFGGAALLFLTYDVPFEEALTICLLDAEDALVERVTLGGPYTTGHLHDLRIAGANRLTFRFFGGAPYRLEIAPHPRWRMPVLGDPPGAWRLSPRRRLLLGR